MIREKTTILMERLADLKAEMADIEAQCPLTRDIDRMIVVDNLIAKTKREIRQQQSHGYGRTA